MAAGSSNGGFHLKKTANDPKPPVASAGASAAEKELSNNIIALTKELKAAKDQIEQMTT